MSSWKNPQLANAAAVLRADAEFLAKGENSHVIDRLQPGRLGDLAMNLGTDARTDPRVRQAMLMYSKGDNAPQPSLLKIGPEPSLDEIGRWIGENEAASSASFEALAKAAPQSAAEEALNREDITLKGGDGQDMLIHVFRPPKQTGPLPAVLYIHGGAMVMFPTISPLTEQWVRSLAIQGVVAILVDYRNAYTAKGFHHFPAGLNDCAAAARYVHAHKQELNVSHVVLQGESGGGNLSLATAMKANREGWINKIAGVYSYVPYISNAWGLPQEEQRKLYPSLIECDGYMISTAQSAYMAHFYAPNEEDQTNPLAWPSYASAEDLKGLPPHAISVDELDIHRDEGTAYARKLANAGVSVDAKIVLGIPHAGSVTFRMAVPEKTAATIRDIAGFAKSL